MPELEKPNTNVEPELPEHLEAPEENEAPLLEPEGEPEPAAPNVHPLAPGGRRFEQVYAKGKQAEREALELKERLFKAEAQLEVLTRGKAEPETEHSWATLETFIQQGRITRADAEAYREDIMARKLAQKVKSEFVTETRQATVQENLTRTIQDYFLAVPAISVDGSADRARLDEEFDWLASVQGLDPSKVAGAKRLELQALALRTVYGPIDAVRKRSTPPRGETLQGLPGGTPPAASPNKDQALLNSLSKRQVAHYKKCMAAGRYKGGWTAVVAELRFDPKNRKRR